MMPGISRNWRRTSTMIACAVVPTARIANELNHQYTLAFSMTHPPDDKFHGLRVRVKRPQHRVRARRGYIATTDRKTF